MAEHQPQLLSELMDGELDAEQAETAVDTLLRDQTLAAEWHRMHQLRGLLRREVDMPFDVSQAVHDAIADEPPYLLPEITPARPTRRWPRYALGGALAASVALATVISLRPWQSAPQTPPPVATSPSPEVSSGVDVAALGGDAEPQQEQNAHQLDRLESYWAVHADNALLAGPEALSPLLSNASIDARK